MAQPPNRRVGAVLALIAASDREGDHGRALRTAAEDTGLAWHPVEPSGAAAALADLCDRQPTGRRVGVVGVGQAGAAAVSIAAADGRVGALGLLDVPVSAEAIALLADWPELPFIAVAAPESRATLAGAVDAYLASTHQASDLLVGPIDTHTVTALAEWLALHLSHGARTDEVTLTTDDGWELHGTRWLPERDHPVPGVVLLHSGRSDRAVFARLERLLAEAGLAVLNLDWRGRGQSTNKGTYFELDAEEKAAGWRDAVAAAAHLADLSEVDGERLAAVGVVHGAEYAVRAAVRDPRIRAVVLLTGYRPADDAEAERLTTGGLHALHVTSTDHRVTTDAMRQLYDASTDRLTRYVEYPGGAIGYQLFEIDHQLEPRIAEWLSEALAP